MAKGRTVRVVGERRRRWVGERVAKWGEGVEGRGRLRGGGSGREGVKMRMERGVTAYMLGEFGWDRMLAEGGMAGSE